MFDCKLTTIGVIGCFLASLAITISLFFVTHSTWTEFSTWEQLACFLTPLLIFGVMLLGMGVASVRRNNDV